MAISWLVLCVLILNLILNGATNQEPPGGDDVIDAGPPGSDNTTDYNMDDRVIPSRFQNSHALVGFRCFPNGVRLPCDCEAQYKCPCCPDYENDECYAPTYYMWSDWKHCDIENYECDDTEECRIKYDEIRPRSWLDETSRRKRKRRAIIMDDSLSHDPQECRVQRVQCRLRRHGEWGHWSQIGQCSSECFVGTLTRERECLDQSSNETLPLDLCPGGADEAIDDTLACNVDACLTKTEWEDSGRCYDSDGDCVIDQTISCTYPEDLVLSEDCSTRQVDCPLDCSLLGLSGYDFGEWADCNATCSPGYESRVGNCIYLIDGHPSTECDPLVKTEYRECETQLCGSYSEWIDGTCDASCGGGFLTSTRICDDSGEILPGCTSRQLTCNEHICTNQVAIHIDTGNQIDADTRASVSILIHGSVSTQVIDLSSTADNFQRGDSDSFSVTIPEFGTINYVTIGHDGTGANPSWFLAFLQIVVDNAATYDFPCEGWIGNDIGVPVYRDVFVNQQCDPGNFIYSWTEYTNCSESCHPGNRTRNGTCIDQTTGMPSDYCVSETYIQETEDCNTDYCEEYGFWSQWSSCSASCGIGEQTRTTVCSNSTQVAPDECVNEELPCTLTPCVEPGPWSDYGACNDTCSPGMKTRTRPCYLLGTTTPADGCVEPLTEDAPCNEALCDQYSDFAAGSGLICNAERNGSECTTRTGSFTRSCDGSGTVPAGCSESIQSCGASALPGGQTDVYFYIENVYYLGQTASPLLDCNPAQTARLDDVKEFLYKFICSYNTFEDSSVSQFAVKAKLGGSLDKAFSDTDLFSAIASIPRICEYIDLFTPYTDFALVSRRAAVTEVFIYIFSHRENLQFTTDAGQINALSSVLIDPSIINVKLALISAFTLDASNEEFAHKYACGDPNLVGLCNRLIGSIYDDPGELISKLNAL